MWFFHIVYPIDLSSNALNLCNNNNTAVFFSSTLTPGCCNGFELATEIQTKINQVVGEANIYTIRYSSIIKNHSFRVSLLGDSIEKSILLK